MKQVGTYASEYENKLPTTIDVLRNRDILIEKEESKLMISVTREKR